METKMTEEVKKLVLPAMQIKLQMPWEYWSWLRKVNKSNTCVYFPLYIVEDDFICWWIIYFHFSGDWTACESALKALERVALDEGGPKNPLTTVSDNVSETFAEKSVQK